eukprot:2177351-Alexandrium_andersonii.AAC.1
MPLRASRWAFFRQTSSGGGRSQMSCTSRMRPRASASVTTERRAGRSAGMYTTPRAARGSIWPLAAVEVLACLNFRPTSWKGVPLARIPRPLM